VGVASQEPTLCTHDADGDGYGDEFAVSPLDAGTDCDDTDSTLESSDTDGDGYSSCDGDCDDNDSSVLPSDCTYDVAIGYSDLVNLFTDCGTTAHLYNSCNGGDIGFEWTDTSGGTPSSIEVQFYSGIGCQSGTVGTELNSVSSGNVSVSPDCTCSPSPDVISLTLTDISGFNPFGTNTFMIGDYNCAGLSQNSSWGNAYAMVTVSF
jgi:hypothetical protein